MDREHSPIRYAAMNTLRLHQHRLSTPSDWHLLVSSQKLMTQAHDVGLTRVGIYVVVDVILSRVGVRTAPNVLLPFPLVYPNVVNQHFRGKCHSGEVNILPARRNT